MCRQQITNAARLLHPVSEPLDAPGHQVLDVGDHAVQVGPSVQNNIPWVIRLFPISGTEKIGLLVRNNSNELRYSLWTGNTFMGDPAILVESSLPANFVPFGIAESGVTYTGGSG